MKIGMNLVLWTLALRSEHYPLLRRLKALGYEGVEITITPGNGEDFGEVRRILDGEGLACTTLTNLPPDANPVDADAAVRRRALDRLQWAVEVSQDLGSSILSGPIYAASDSFTGRGPRPYELQRAVDFLRMACAAAQSAGVTLCLEYLSRFETYLVNTAAQASVLVDRVGADNLGLALDTHHAHLEEGDLRQAIVSAGSRIRHLHFSESHRGTLGQGLLDWSSVVGALKSIGYDGWLMVEAFSAKVQPLARKAHVWRNVFDDPDQLARDAIDFTRRIWSHA